MSLQLCMKLEAFKNKYKDAHLIIGGDYNDAPDNLVDRIPIGVIPHSRFKSTAYICEQLEIIDVWRFTLTLTNLPGAMSVDPYSLELIYGLYLHLVCNSCQNHHIVMPHFLIIN